MLTRFRVFAVGALSVLLAGCAAGFRAGGPNRGVEAGAAAGPAAAPVAPAVPAGRGVAGVVQGAWIVDRRGARVAKEADQAERAEQSVAAAVDESVATFEGVPVGPLRGFPDVPVAYRVTAPRSSG